ncbi:PREDICTED: uncharacterized protein LOC104698678 [Camelina sativa]|uniref:Uncharacterized protein LOC104698678 n=1 Tax=Camelina sativa TaxID=90675 RepID=A0ABM0SKD1_CAMSA|nr:PREDICTED: uncharacterized protein LOC104698678 [Camelina sativa]
MRTAAWNCRGLGNDLAVRRLKEIKKTFSPDIICLMETKQGNDVVRSVGAELGYDHVFTVPPIGLSGGVALFWNSSLSVSVLYHSLNLVDTYVKINGFGFYLSCVYGNPNPSLRHLVRERLERTTLNRTGPWMAIGDFNEIKSNSEKKGGPPRHESSFADFRNMLQVCDFHEPKFKGNPFSWTGKRYSHDIACCLDKTLANSEWHGQYPASHAEFLELLESDHRPVITTITSDFNPRQGQFCYDNRLLNREGFQDAINRGWNHQHLGHETQLTSRLQECRKAIFSWKRRNKPNAQEEISILKNLLDKAHSDGLLHNVNESFDNN